ncbi:MAG: chorismate synthase, partial [Clostridiales bacterium]|nr:chorismate synthase [Clostridiales bacterium]
GGTVTVLISGLPAGVGSYVQYDRKLDAVLAMHLMSIQAVKSVSFGLGQAAAARLGSGVHDEMFIKDGKVVRKTNRAGGIEGGMSNGEPIVLRVTFKPIPTLVKGLKTVDVRTGEATTAAAERSDVCAVPAGGVVAESALAFVLANELLRVSGGDALPQIQAAVEALRQRGNVLP